MYLLMLVYLVLVLIRPQDYPQWVDSIPVPLLQVTLMAAMLFWLFSAKKSFAAPQYLLLLVFLGILMLSKIVNGWTGGAVVQLTKFGPVLAAFVIFANATLTRDRVLGAMVVFVLCAVVMSFHGIEQAHLGVGWTGIELSQGTRIQYVGIFNDPNDLGLLFVMCLPMAMYLAARGGMMGLRRLFWWAAAAVLLYGIYLTNSRGALLATLVVLGVYAWRRFGLFAAGALGAVGLVGMMALPSRLQEMEVGEASAMGRVDSWYEGMQMFVSRPIFGVGADAYSDYHALTAHNSFVLVLAETGIIGFTVWLAFVGYTFRMPLAVLRHRPELPDRAAERAWRDERRIALTLLLSLCGFFAAAFFLSRSYVVLLYLLAALVVGYFTGVRERWPGIPGFELQRDLLRWPIISVVSVVALYLVVKVLFALA